MNKLDVKNKLSNFIKEQDIIDDYINVLTGWDKTFDKGFWEDNGRYKIGVIIRYIQTNILKCDVEDMYHITYGEFKSLRLWGGLRQVYNNKFIDAIVDAYTIDGEPKLMRHRFKHIPHDYWTVESYIDAVRFEVNDKYPHFNASGLMDTWSTNFIKNDLLLHRAYKNLKSIVSTKDTLLLSFPRNFVLQEGKIVVTDEKLKF